MKRYWISGLRISQIEETHPEFQKLQWIDPQTPPYSVQLFVNKKNSSGIIATSDSFGGRIGWAQYKGATKLIGKEMEPIFDKDELEFLKGKYPTFIEAINHIDA